MGLNPSQFRWHERKAVFGLELLLKELSSWCYLWKVCELLFLLHPLADWYEMYFTLLLKKFWGEGRRLEASAELPSTIHLKMLKISRE